VRQKIRTGRLPRHSVAIVAGGPGGSGICAACGGPLKMTQLVMTLPGNDGGPTQLHADCYVVWDQLRRSCKSVRSCE
jgi:hypothetical protein